MSCRSKRSVAVSTERATTNGTTPRCSNGSGRIAVSYVRVSGLGQVDGDGLPRQRQVIAGYARLHHVHVVAEFADPGVSGTKELEHREGLSALVERLGEGNVGVVLVENATRIARDLLVGEVILQRLRGLGVRVVAADSGTNLTDDADPTKVLIRQLLNALSQFERTTLVGKLAAARTRLRRAGERCEGQKPFGTLEGEQETLQRARELRRKPRGGKRRSLAEVARVLYAEGHATRRGGRWCAGSLQKVLGRR